MSFCALLGSMTEDMSTAILPAVTWYAVFRSVRENLPIRYSSWSSCVLRIMSSWDLYLRILATVIEQLRQLIEAQPRQLWLEPHVTTLCFEEERSSLPGETTGGSRNLGTPGIKENARLRSDSLDAQPSEDNLPFQFTLFTSLAQ